MALKIKNQYKYLILIMIMLLTIFTFMFEYAVVEAASVYLINNFSYDQSIFIIITATFFWIILLSLIYLFKSRKLLYKK
jgi:cell division protein FtsW (lipid II flippase)